MTRTGTFLAAAAIVIGQLFASAGFSQSGPVTPAPRFDAASVKHLAPGAPPPVIAPNSWRPPREHGRYTLRYASLTLCLQIAYGVLPYRISTPAWGDAEHYEILATMPPGTPDDQVLLMLQNLLLERFQLKLHWEEKEMAAWVLVVDKNGPKLTRTADADAVPRFGRSGGSFQAVNHSMTDLAGMLMLWTDRPVVDMTGIEGSFDFKLTWSNLNLPPSPTGIADGAPVPAMSLTASDPEGVLAALPKLGLKAVPRKIPIRFLIVEHGEKDPTGN